MNCAKTSTKSAIEKLAILIFVLTFPAAVEAGVVSSAASKAASVNAAKAASKSVTKPKDVLVSRGKHPESAAHIEYAQRQGQPSVLTIDRAGRDSRRQDALRNIRRKDSSPQGKDRDEYPPAMTREGGANANVRYIDQSDNRGSGKALDHQTSSLPDGAKIRVLVID